MDKTAPASRDLLIPDKYLARNDGPDNYGNDNNAYFDFQEVKDGTSSYVSQADVPPGRANFWPTGIILGEEDHNDDNDRNSQIRGVLWDNPIDYIQVYSLATKIVHPLRFRRIYFGYKGGNGTTARGIRFVGNKGNE